MKEIELTLASGKVVTENIYTAQEFDYAYLSSFSLIKGKRGDILDCVCAFDIETTTIPAEKYGFMYLWQFCVENRVIMGRRWEDLIYLIAKLKQFAPGQLIVYVHNLGFEFQFMRNFFGWDNVFATEKRKVLKCATGNIEFRCSYRLFNMSFARVCKNNGVQYYKRGDFDYKKIRTAETELNDEEIAYGFCDVRGLTEAVRKKLDGDTLASIPLTSTGYVRRECRNAMRKNKANRKRFEKCRVSEEVYMLLNEAKRGGNTHADRLFVGRILENARSFDAVSSYPFQMMVQYYPASPFILLSRNVSRETFRKSLGSMCCLFRVAFKNLEVKLDVPVPYISYHKCLSHNKEDIVFNGRLLKSPGVAMTLTEIDFEIIEKQYDWDEIGISDFYVAERGELPPELKAEIRKYFVNKTSKKKEDPYLYAKSKELINAIFGMMCTDPVHDEITVDETWHVSPRKISDELKRYYKSKNSFLNIQDGVYVTAHARAWLQQIIDITDMDTIYCDTDSDKCLDIDEEKLAELNQKAIELCEKNGAYCDFDGKRYYMGIFEEESPYKEFATWGAKKYAYTQQDGLHITIAGVNKQKGAEYLTEHGGLKAFKPGLVFPAGRSGRTTSYWNDMPEPYYVTVDGCRMLTASNIGVVESEYTLGITDEFSRNRTFNILTNDLI